MENNSQNTIKDLRKQLKRRKTQLEQEISKHRQAEKRIRILREELAAIKFRLALYAKNTEERIRFDMLLSGISAHFINLPPDRVDSEIKDAQRRVCECLGLDLCTLWQWEVDDPDTLIMTHLYRPLGGPPVPERMDADGFFPWCQQEIKSGRIIAVSSMDDLPPEAARDAEAWRHYGVRTSLTIPLGSGSGPIFGALSFNDVQSERNWTDTLVKRLQMVAQIFTSALVRKRTDEILREKERRLSLTTDAAGAGLWIYEPATGKVWVSGKARELFHCSQDEDLDAENFLKNIHPEDRRDVNQAMQQSIRSGDALHIDCRVILPDDVIRWIVLRGQRHLNSNGEPLRLMGVSVDITGRKHSEKQIRESLREIEELKQRLENENLYLQKELQFLGKHMEIVGQSLAMKRILAEAEQVANTDSTVLILGETGTGKEMLARAIHQISTRKDGPMVTVNCAALPPSLIESELFGREKGAYTGALTKMIGRFEIADRSTLFLDEIAELPIELQSKLLRVIEEGTFERLGSTKPLHVNVRIIAATNRDIEHEVEEGRFRKDLFYRLNVFPIMIPPLRERPQDIPLLVWAFVKEFQKRMGKEVETISIQTMEALQSYSWPGNVRELRNVVEHAMILNGSSNLVVSLPKTGPGKTDDSHDLDQIERKHIKSILEKTGWRIGGKGGTAEILGLKRSTLQSKMKKLGISRPDH